MLLLALTARYLLRHAASSRWLLFSLPTMTPRGVTPGGSPVPAFLIKTAITAPRARQFVFARQRTMYGGRRIAAGDVVYLFASENEGGAGLIARGIVTAVKAVPRRPGIERQTPRVSIEVTRTALAKRRLGRAELTPFVHWKDGRAGTELNFKFYRQATNKIGGISPQAAAFLETFL